MNTVEATVTKVIGKPYMKTLSSGQYWFVDVEYNCQGSVGKTNLMFKYLKQACEVNVGYVFQV